MRLSNFKNRKWENLTEKEKKEWDEFAIKNGDMLKLLNRFSKLRKCYMCKHKFLDGILVKHPFEIVPLLNMFRGDFLFHLKETHGLDPETFKSICLKINET